MDKIVNLILKELAANLTNLYGKRLKGVYLYGSCARGEDAEGSDIDIALILDDFKDHWEEIQRTSQLVSEISLKYGVTLSLYRIREEDWRGKETPLLINIRREGMLI